MTRDRILYLLKTKGPQQTAALAKRLAITPVAVRQHLDALRHDGLVAYDEPAKGVGRPARIWRLDAAAQGHFPDSHGELTVGMLDAMTKVFGEDGLKKLVAERTNAQAKAYRARVDTALPLAKKVAALAAIRREEGYMAEWSRSGDAFVLIENHCPICAAATVCQGLCAGELELFKRILGAKVERTEHLLDGARRCSYVIRS